MLKLKKSARKGAVSDRKKDLQARSGRINYTWTKGKEEQKGPKSKKGQR